MSRILTSLIVLTGSATFTLARADVQLPLQKPGLWETHMQQTLMGRKQDVVSKACLTSEVQQKMRAMSEGLRKESECTVTTTHPAPNIYVTESRCTKGRLAGSVTRTTTTYTSDGAFHQEVHTQGSDSVMALDSRYLGSCPADMAPGDTVVNGMKMNILSH